MSSIPTLKEEIERKAIEEIERLHLARDRGQISEAQLDLSLRVIYNCISGLVDWDIPEAIVKTLDSEIKEDKSFYDIRTFGKGGVYFFVSRRYSGNGGGGKSVLVRTSQTRRYGEVIFFC